MLLARWSLEVLEAEGELAADPVLEFRSDANPTQRGRFFGSALEFGACLRVLAVASDSGPGFLHFHLLEIWRD